MVRSEEPFIILAKKMLRKYNFHDDGLLGYGNGKNLFGDFESGGQLQCQ